MSCAHGPERGNVELGFTIAAWHRIKSAALLEGLKDGFDRVLEFLFGIEDLVVFSWQKARVKGQTKMNEEHWGSALTHKFMYKESSGSELKSFD